MSSGQDALQAMVDGGELEVVPADLAGAKALITKARRHHVSARTLAASDPETAIGALHAGNRKALDAVLLAMGLRPTKTGGHVASGHAIRAILGSKSAVAVYDTVRRVRNEGDYHSATTDVHSDDVTDNLDDSEALVNACDSALSVVTPFVPAS